MSSLIARNDTCPHCHADNAVYGEFWTSGEYKYGCCVCGCSAMFRFKREAGKLVYRTTMIPIDQVVLTVRSFAALNEFGTGHVVWESSLPEDADTAFIELYLAHKGDEIAQQYPGFVFPDLASLQKGGSTGVTCAIEKRLQSPSWKDGEPYICLNRRLHRLELQENEGKRVLAVHKVRYWERERTGGGFIYIADVRGETQFCRELPTDITIRRAERLWAAHINQNTDHTQSYLTLMRDGNLQVLKGTLPGPDGIF